MSLTNPQENKMMQGAPAKKSLREFFFAGGRYFHPMTVLAETIQEAEQLFHKTKRPLEAAVSQPDTAAPIEQSTSDTVIPEKGVESK